MKNLFKSLVVIALLQGGVVAQNDVKHKFVCEGKYSAFFRDSNGDPKTVDVDQWNMDSMPDGSYSVDIDLTPTTMTSARTERHLLTEDLKPKNFVSIIVNGAGSNKQSIKIECEYGITELGCRTTHNGLLAAATMKQEPPYVFWPSLEIATFDLPWAFQAFSAQAARVVGHKTSIPLVSIEQGQATNGISLKIQEIDQVEYLGRESVDILGQRLSAHKFQLVDQMNGAQEFWVSESGILLTMELGGGRAIRLTHYSGRPLAP